jgi:hypothetical protein
MPDAYNDLANFILSQFSSVTVTPLLIPKIWVCTAPATAVLHISELLTTTDGAEAVGGVLFVTTVLETVFVSAPFALVIALITNIKHNNKNNSLISNLCKFLTILKL